MSTRRVHHTDRQFGSAPLLRRLITEDRMRVLRRQTHVRDQWV